jgi:hypothetical protein
MDRIGQIVASIRRPLNGEIDLLLWGWKDGGGFSIEGNVEEVRVTQRDFESHH